jgi:hypothetical protein
MPRVTVDMEVVDQVFRSIHCWLTTTFDFEFSMKWCINKMHYLAIFGIGGYISSIESLIG